MATSLALDCDRSLSEIAGYAEFLEKNSSEPMMSFTAQVIRQMVCDLKRMMLSFDEWKSLNAGQLNLIYAPFLFSSVAKIPINRHQTHPIYRGVVMTWKDSDEDQTLFIDSDPTRLLQILDAFLQYVLHHAFRGAVIQMGLTINRKTSRAILTIEQLEGRSLKPRIDDLESIWLYGDAVFETPVAPSVEMRFVRDLFRNLGGQCEFDTELTQQSKILMSIPVRRIENVFF